MEFRSERYFRPAVREAEARHRELLAELVPDAEVEHIGATAVAGLLTKGDLDLLVRIGPGQLREAAAALGERYAANQPEEWTEEFASFSAPEAGDVPVGVQLVVAGSEWDLAFRRWRKLLTVDPVVRHRYNELKRAHQGASPDAYLEAKARFIEEELAGPARSDPHRGPGAGGER